jgi:hypothetical protein
MTRQYIMASFRNPNNLPHYLIALFTLGLAIFACYAWVASREQLKIMQDDQRPWAGSPIIIGCALYGSPFDTIIHKTGYWARIDIVGHDVRIPFVYTVDAE